MSKKYLNVFLRHPKTRQEIRENLDKHDVKVRAKRRNLPTVYDDIFVKKQKSWKWLKRKNQYRDADCNYAWHEFTYSIESAKNIWEYDKTKENIISNLREDINQLGLYSETICYRDQDNLIHGIKWFGPDLVKPWDKINE